MHSNSFSSRYFPTLILVMIPAFMMLGLDIFLNFQNKQLLSDFRLSDYGFIMQHFSPDDYRLLMRIMPDDQLGPIVWILQQKSVLVQIAYGLIMLCLMPLLYCFLKLFSGPSGQQGPSQKLDKTIDTKIPMRGETSKRIKYKRR